jgi:ElaB/YqjD/DUF883 family membrane-anchored ribosome-binding protein
METKQLTSKIQDWHQRATEKAKDWGQKTDQYVRENTWMTLGVAVLFGVVVGYMLANRGDD